MRTPSNTFAWNKDKPHRCPNCHAIYIDGSPKSFGIYECCECGVAITRWPRLAAWLPFYGIVCPDYGTPYHPHVES